MAKWCSWRTNIEYIFSHTFSLVSILLSVIHGKEVFTANMSLLRMQLSIPLSYLTFLILKNMLKGYVEHIVGGMNLALPFLPVQHRKEVFVEKRLVEHL